MMHRCRKAFMTVKNPEIHVCARFWVGALGERCNLRMMSSQHSCACIANTSRAAENLRNQARAISPPLQASLTLHAMLLAESDILRLVKVTRSSMTGQSRHNKQKALFGFVCSPIVKPHLKSVAVSHSPCTPGQASLTIRSACVPPLGGYTNMQEIVTNVFRLAVEHLT